MSGNDQSHKQWFIGIVVTVGVGLLGAFVVYHVQEREWERQDKANQLENQRIVVQKYVEQQRDAEIARQREQAEIPELQVIGSRFENGYAVVTVKNSSRTRPANVTEATFTITDSATLDKIAKIHPPPRGIGAANHVDDLFFKQGFWLGDSYVYCVRLGLNVEPGGKATDLRLAVLDSRLKNVRLKGDLSINYEAAGSGVRQLTLERGQIPVK